MATLFVIVCTISRTNGRKPPNCLSDTCATAFDPTKCDVVNCQTFGFLEWDGEAGLCAMVMCSGCIECHQPPATPPPPRIVKCPEYKVKDCPLDRCRVRENPSSGFEYCGDSHAASASSSNTGGADLGLLGSYGHGGYGGRSRRQGPGSYSDDDDDDDDTDDSSSSDSHAACLKGQAGFCIDGVAPVNRGLLFSCNPQLA